MRTVREATFDVLREHDLTTIFANPGSTEVPFLTDLPDDLRFVLALHEGSVVGAATGLALARERPSLVLLHTTAGLGNAVGALATARENRAPLVVLVGQQDRRHLALEPFLTGHLTGLAGSYPIHVDQPVRAQDVPGAVARASYEARQCRGPAVVIVPMDDWDERVDADLPVAAPGRLRRAPSAPPSETLGELAATLDHARSPALVVGAGADSPEAWEALAGLAERLESPVRQEAFGARAGFPQDHRLFAGHLPPDRSGLRAALASHDVVLVVGTAAFRQYPYEPGPLVPEGVTLAVVTDDPGQAHRSPADTAVLADPARTCSALASRLTPRDRRAPELPERPAAPSPPAREEQPRAAHVLSALAERLPRDTVIVEETPSSRPDLHALVPARAPMGFVSAAMGGLGFALPAAAGIRMGAPHRPVVAVTGDGSALYQIQSLWTAGQYDCGVLAVVLSNGGYAIMDALAQRRGGEGPWPGFDEVRVAGLARSFGCEAIKVADYGSLVGVLDKVVPNLADRSSPLVLDVSVASGGDPTRPTV